MYAAAILNSCAALLPANAVDPALNLTDFRGTFGDSVIGSRDSATNELKSWRCSFMRTESGEFKAVDLNEAKFIPPVPIHSGGAVVFPTLQVISNAEPIVERVVWQGGGAIDGVKIPASQLILGAFQNGAVSVKVDCPDLPTATASISQKGIGLYSVWVPSDSPDCKMLFFDNTGKVIK